MWTVVLVGSDNNIHRASPPPCIASYYRCAHSSIHLRGSLLRNPWLQLEKWSNILPFADRCSECSELWHQPSEADLHHFILLNNHVDEGEGVTDILDLGCVIRHRMILLSNIAQLISELQLLGRRASGENTFQIRPCIFWHFGILDVAQQLITHPGCKEVQNFACACSQARKSLCINSGATSLAPST